MNAPHTPHNPNAIHGPVTNPRDVAVTALRDRDGNVSAHLDRLLAEARLGPVDRAFARELALGALRRRATLRAALERLLVFPMDKLRHGAMLEIFDVALYQIFFLDRVPPHAVVNEAVEQAARFNHRKKAGLVNGVLRGLLRSLGSFEQGPPPLASNVVAVSPSQFRRCDRPLLPEPSQETEFLAAACSLPLELARRWLSRFGSLPKAFDLAMAANVRAPLVLRVNRLKTSPEEVLARFAAEAVAAAPHASGVSIVLLEPRNVTELPGFAEGWFQPQDPTATAVGLACAELDLFGAETRVLDFCAAPGTKTTHLAELMSDAGSILALDVTGEKLAKIEENCRRLGVTNVTTGLAQSAGSLQQGTFDLVLADVPCSNTGVLSRRAEARWRFSESALAKLVRDQYQLAAMAWRFVKPGGYFVYSTCSIEPEECGDVVRRLARHHRGEIIREHLTLPVVGESMRWQDGGYYAILRAKFFREE